MSRVAFMSIIASSACKHVLGAIVCARRLPSQTACRVLARDEGLCMTSTTLESA
jgi:hypothetical protein